MLDHKFLNCLFPLASNFHQVHVGYHSAHVYGVLCFRYILAVEHGTFLIYNTD